MHALQSRVGKLNINIKIAKLRPMVYLTFFRFAGTRIQLRCYDKLPSGILLGSSLHFSFSRSNILDFKVFLKTWSFNIIKCIRSPPQIYTRVLSNAAVSLKGMKLSSILFKPHSHFWFSICHQNWLHASCICNFKSEYKL